MTIQKSGSLQNWGFIGIIASVLLIVSLMVAGCTQNSPDNSGQSAAVPAPSDTTGGTSSGQGAAGVTTPADAGQQSVVPVASVDSVGQGSGVSPSGAYSGGGQHTGGNFLTNETRIAAAAQKLGVSEADLKSALTPPAQGRVNFTAAAAQLGVTTDQLSAALGIPAGGMGNSTRQHGGYNATNGGIPPGQ